MPITGVASTSAEQVTDAPGAARRQAPRARRRVSTAAGSGVPAQDPAITEHQIAGAAPGRGADLRSKSSGRGGSARRRRPPPPRASACSVGARRHPATSARSQVRRAAAARRQNQTPRWRRSGCASSSAAGDRGQGDVVAREQAPGREHRVALRDILTGCANVRAAGDGSLDEQPEGALAGDLHLRDGVETVIDRLAGVDAQVAAGRQRAVPGLRGDDGIAVHRRTAVRRVGGERDQRACEHAARRGIERHALGGQRRRLPTRRRERRARPKPTAGSAPRSVMALRERSARPRRRC